MATFAIEIEGLERLKKTFEQAPKKTVTEISRAIKNSVNMIRPIMKTEAPHKSGNLQRSISARSSALEGSVGVDLEVAPYALYVHEGTKAHDIFPKTKKALWWKGALHPMRSVKHPGTKANPFVARTVDKVKPMVNAIFQRAIENITASLK